ncbi:hypothetical protein F5B19DRAFT_440744 [Rostrohypoxylon terebratum]|nr:hypothetical protein F5B19DRAFT_440744 [Rostrohypoxylon terebratum]
MNSFDIQAFLDSIAGPPGVLTGPEAQTTETTSYPIQDSSPTSFPPFKENSLHFPVSSYVPRGLIYVPPPQTSNPAIPATTPTYIPESEFLGQKKIFADPNFYPTSMPPVMDQSTNVFSPQFQGYSNPMMSNPLATPLYDQYGPVVSDMFYGHGNAIEPSEIQENQTPCQPEVPSQPEMITDQSEVVISQPESVTSPSEDVTNQPESQETVNTSNSLSEPLSLLSKHVPHMPIPDVSTYVNRGSKQRLKEDVNDEGGVKAPPSAFNLYVKAYRALADELVRTGFIKNQTRLNRSHFATKIIGLS